MSEHRDGIVIRRRFVCRGVVQGVGFRPAIWRLAHEIGVGGSVGNDGDGVTIEIEGPPQRVGEFESRLTHALPPRAALRELVVHDVRPCGERVFSIEPTRFGPVTHALTPPDVALCPACRRELATRGDRRFGYAFTTCTDCGPRYSVVRALPYDRERTSMECYPLCPTCAAEYRDPTSRRFHAESIACPKCGPRLWAAAPDGHVLGSGEDGLEIARRAIAHGGIVAVKGIGGFQLVCRADMPEPVARLRVRKGRPRKPFAVMARDLSVARSLVELRPTDEQWLVGPAGPIVIARRAPGAPVARQVAPGIDDLGVMLPTTPLHVELLRARAPAVVVATSGNRTDEPICTGNREALRRLRGIADVFLLHDRDIVRRVDDSVVRTLPSGHVLVRRSRGFVPTALPLPERAPEPLLALGGHLQATVCVAHGDDAFLSQHVGDLDTELARAFQLEVATGLEGFLGVTARVLVADLHPDYPSGWAAERLAAARGGRVVRVQHHVAHVAATLAEHGAFPGPDERVAGVVLDGTGFGPDGTAWGAEWLELDGRLGWRRSAHATPLPLVGGERAVREPWRIAVAALALAGWSDESLAALPLAELVDGERIAKVGALARGAWPRACGAGRLFEALGALCGVAAENTFEGEAALRAEDLAMQVVAPDVWDEVVVGAELPAVELLAAAATRLRAGATPAAVAAGFHATFCRLAAELTARVVTDGVVTVAFGGGCLVNRLLVDGLTREHRARGFTVLVPQRVPPGDGGLAYGQSVLAAVGAARGVTPIP